VTRHGRTNHPLSRILAHYLREHAKPATRAIHFLGTVVAMASLGGLILSGNLWFLAGVLVGGYGPAWTAHFFVEHNQPATFRYPLWSPVSDYRMAGMWLTGGLRDELAKASAKPR
jgi:hypothetical protein